MANKLTSEDIKLNLIVNGNQAQAAYNKLSRTIQNAKHELTAVRSEMKAMEAQGKASGDSWDDLDKQMRTLEKTIDVSIRKQKQLTEQIKLEDKTIEQLKGSIRSLRAARSKAAPDSKEYDEYTEQLQLARQRLNELEYGANQTGKSLINMERGLSRYVSGTVAGVASITAAVSGINKAKRDFAEFDDIMSDVQKTTNATRDEVVGLDKDLHNLITRTSDEDLLGLGRIAGKLGYTDLQEIQEFIGATNQIVVALNQDLGGNVEETVNKIGKLIDIFQLRDIYDTEEAFLKVGSAINELGMASTANEGYMVEFARRMAGIAPLADISIEEVLGLGATLDQLGQTAEVSSTSLSKLFLGIAKDAEAYAKYAGMQVSEFKDLLENDFMKAFTRVLRGVKGSSEGINELAATLGDLRQDGGRVVGVIGSLANNVDILEEQIELSNKAMQEGTSITEEYNIKNSNAAAQLDITRKEVRRLWRELGEKLWPTIIGGNKLLTTFLSILSKILTFAYENRKTIATLTITILAYNIALRASAIALVAKTTAIKVATAAMRIFNAAIRMNPIGFLVTALAAAGSALYFFSGRTDTATRAQEKLNEAQSKAEAQTEVERRRINHLTDLINAETTSRENKLIAIKELRNIMPDVLQNYTDEEILAGKAKKSIDEYAKSLIQLSRIRMKQSELDRLIEEDRKYEAKKTDGFWAKAGEYIFGKPNIDYFRGISEQQKKERKELIDMVAKDLAKDEDALKRAGFDINDFNPTDEINSTTVSGVGKPNKDAKAKAAAIEREKQYWIDIAAAQQEGYEKELYQLDERFAQTKKVLGANHKDLAAIEKVYLDQRAQIEKDIAERNQKEEIKKSREQRENLRQEWQETYNQAKFDAEEYYLERLQIIENSDLTEEQKQERKEEEFKAHQQRLEGIERERLTTRLIMLEALKEVGDLEIDEERRIADEILKIRSDLIKKETDLLQNANKKKLDDEIKLMEATYDLKEETAKAFEAGFALLGNLVQENAQVANALLVLEKAAAAAAVIINLQKELSIYAVRGATNPISAATNAARAVKAKIRAGISLATIAGTTISGISSNNRKEERRMSGRASGGFFGVTRDQDGRRFNARYRPDQRGYINDPTVLVGEEGREWVASAQALANPDVGRIISILDTAQRQGEINTLGMADILRQSGLVGSKTQDRATGGYTSTSAAQAVTSQPDLSRIDAALERNSQTIDRLLQILENGITAEVSLLGRNGLEARQKELNHIREKARL